MRASRKSSLEKCIGCVKCVKACPGRRAGDVLHPRGAGDPGRARRAGSSRPRRSTKRRKTAAELLAGYRGVWVFIEQTEGEAARVSWELLGKGRELAEAWASSLRRRHRRKRRAPLLRGVPLRRRQRPTSSIQPVYSHYRTEPYLEALCHLIDKYKPEIILMGATGMGRDLAGAVATRVKTGLTADCTGLVHRRQAQPDADPPRFRRQHHGHHHVRQVPSPDGHRPPPCHADAGETGPARAARSSGKPSPSERGRYLHQGAARSSATRRGRTRSTSPAPNSSFPAAGA